MNRRWRAGLAWLVFAALSRAAKADEGTAGECAQAGGGAGDVWSRAGEPRRAEYCEQIARAETRLGVDPAGAKRAALRAGELGPDRVAPLVLSARADVAAGDYPGGVAGFGRALARDRRAVTGAPALLAYATALRETGDRHGAAEAFRAMVVRGRELPAATRATALLDAATAIGAAGPSSLEDATAVVRLVLDGAPGPARPRVLALLALYVDRAGGRPEAAVLAAEAVRAGALRASANGYADEQLAVAARLREASDVAGARASWEAFLAGVGGGGPWADHARRRLAELRAGKVARGAGR